MNIYLDELFAINFISCLCMILITRRLLPMTGSRARLIAAGLAGAALACKRFISGNMAFAAAEIIIPLIALRRPTAAGVGIFMLIKYALSGICALAVSLFGASSAVISGGVIYFDVSLTVFAASFALTLILGAAFSAALRRRRSREFYTLVITNAEKSVRLKALYDSGNLLRDPYDGSYVVIADKDAVSGVWDGSFRLIPFKTVGTENGLMKAFKADKTEIVETGTKINNITVAVCEAKLSKNRKIQALIGFKELTI